jgi:hypothetical protein
MMKRSPGAAIAGRAANTLVGFKCGNTNHTGEYLGVGLHVRSRFTDGAEEKVQ